MKLQKYISNYSNFSRREAEYLIKSGKVKVNGSIILIPYYDINPDDKVEVNNFLIKPKEYVYYAFNKPPEVVSTIKRGKDDFLKNKKIIYDFFRENNIKEKNLKIAGRLDFLSEGLIILSNDGEFINILTHPSYQVEKEYILISYKEIILDFIKGFENGILIKGTFYKAKEIKKIDKYSTKIILTEGKNREIRNVAGFFKQPIRRLIRTRIANIKLENLEYGKIKKIDLEKIKEIKLIYKKNKI